MSRSVSRSVGLVRRIGAATVLGFGLLLGAGVACSGGDPSAGPAREDAAMTTLDVRSSAFGAGGTIPREFTCDGKDVSPPLEWSQGPEGTRSYALIVDDPDAPAGTWTHWVLWNLADPRLPEAVSKDHDLPSGARQGRNSWPRTGYGGPCPPPPTGEHRYVFTVFALDGELDLGSRTDVADLRRAMEGHILAHGQLIGRYRR